jgi:plasmid segregation protein ParM
MPDSYIYNGKRYFVGEKAKSNAMSTRGYGFLSNYGPLLAYHAIIKTGLDTNQPIKLITGLSIMNWSDSDNFLSIMSTINVDDIVIKPSVTLMAQGQGVLNDYDGDKDGMVCVVDIGYNTFNFLVFEDGMPRKDLSYADPIGANKIITDLQAIVKRKFNAPLTELAAKEIFVRGKVNNFGHEVDFSNEIAELKEEYNTFIMDELRTKSLEILRQSKAVIFSGGGAYFLEGTELPSNVVFSEVPYEFGNVRGYFKGKNMDKIKVQIVLEGEDAKLYNLIKSKKQFLIAAMKMFSQDDKLKMLFFSDRQFKS